MIFISDPVRAAGCMIGLAIGDALGAPFEGGPPLPIPVRNFAENPERGLHRGDVTDDTRLALAVARSLSACRGYSPDDLVRRLVGEYRRAPWFFGPTSGAVMKMVIGGVPARTAARLVHERNGQSRSNGSIMRGPPLAVFYPPVRVWEYSLDSSRLTHFDPVAGEASAAFNMIASGLCRGIPAQRLLPAARRRCTIPEINRMLDGRQNTPLDPSMDAVDTLRCALTIGLGARSFEEAVVTAVSLGGDTDTNAALAGALAGARFGLAGIPSRFIAGLAVSKEVFYATAALRAAAVD